MRRRTRQATTSDPSHEQLIAWPHRVTGAVTALVIAACTYGVPEVRVTITNHVMAPSGARVAFAVHAIRSRAPTGLSAFPDGGVALVLNEGAAIYVCDTATLKVERIWQMDRPAEFRSGFGPWIGPWTQAGLYLSTSGYTTSTTDPAAFRRHDYLFRTDGTVDSGVERPARRPASTGWRPASASTTA